MGLVDLIVLYVCGGIHRLFHYVPLFMDHVQMAENVLASLKN